MDKTVCPFQGIVPQSILKDMSKVGRRQMDCRRSHGFIIKLRGSTEYCCGDDSWLLSAGQVLYVSQGASYFIREVEPGYSYVVNFPAPSIPTRRLKSCGFPRALILHPLPRRSTTAGKNRAVLTVLFPAFMRCWQKRFLTRNLTYPPGKNGF